MAGCFLTNIDRTFRNTNMLMWHKELWLIDHGAALYFHHSWGDWQQAACSPFQYVKDHVLLPQATQLAEADAFCRAAITEALIRQIAALLPDEWLQWEDTEQTPEVIRGVYTEFLLARLEHAAIFLQQATDARAALI